MQMDWTNTFHADTAPTTADELLPKLEAFVRPLIQRGETKVGGAGTGGTSFEIIYKHRDGRGGFVAFVHELKGGGMAVSMHQYEIR